MSHFSLLIPWALSLLNSDLWFILVNFYWRWLLHAMPNRRGFDVDITSIYKKENINKFPHHFDVVFRCNFDGWKIDVVSTYFLPCNFDEQKIDVFSTYFIRRNFDERYINVVSIYFFSNWFRWTKNQRCFSIFFGAI